MARQILFAIDGSEHSAHAVDYALKNILEPNDEVTLVHVVEAHISLATPFMGMAAGELSSKIEEQARAEGSALLASVGQKVAPQVKHVHTVLLSGAPKHALAGYASEKKPDLLIVASRGRGAMSRAILGSVSDHLVHHSGCSVLVVRE